MKIILNNNRSKLVGSAKIILAIREHPLFAIRIPGAFFSPAFRKRQWDGIVRFITETGTLDTGKVPQFISVMKEKFPNEGVEIIDERDDVSKPSRKDLPESLGGLEVRDYQREAVKSIAINKVGGVLFPRGVIKAATNAGKTLIAAMLHTVYKSNTLFIISSKDLLDQAIKEIPLLLPGQVGVLASGHPLVWKPFMIVMVKTAKSRMDDIQDRFIDYPVVLVDECDLATSKTYRSVLNHTYNSFVRVGLSGSAFADPRKKEKNERLRAIFGDILYEITNRELMDAGYSSEVKCFMWRGNEYKSTQGYVDEYENGIIKNKHRNRKIVSRALNHAERRRLPLMIITKNHKHVLILYKLLKSKTELTVNWVHHKNLDRQSIVESFAQGKLDILVSSYILKRGQNFPYMRALINSGGGDSIANVLQILGRATRKHKSKNNTILDDFYDYGKYLLKHSKHRLSTYKNEKLTVIEKYGKKNS